MTRKELFNQIWRLPNFLYRYENENEQRDYYTLLGYSGSNQPVEFTLSTQSMNILDDMIDLFNKQELTEIEKSDLARNIHRLQRMCEYRFENSKTKVEQEAFINELSEANFSLLCKQVEMYVFARQLYGKGYR